MIKISKRLEAISSLVPINTNIIDVGCDHAYLDIYLTLNNSNKCLATDINKNALKCKSLFILKLLLDIVYNIFIVIL